MDLWRIEPGTTYTIQHLDAWFNFGGFQCKGKTGGSSAEGRWDGQDKHLTYEQKLRNLGLMSPEKGSVGRVITQELWGGYKDDRSGQFYEPFILKFSHWIPTFHCFFSAGHISFFITGCSHYFHTPILCTFMTIYPLLTSFNIIENHVTTVMQ